LDEFAEERTKAEDRLQAVRSQLEEKTSELEEVRNQITKAKTEWRAQKQEELKQAREALEEEREKLREQAAKIEKQAAALESREEELERRRERLSSRRERLEERIEERSKEIAGQKIRQRERKISLLEQDQSELTSQLEAKRKKLSQLRKRLQDLGGQNVSDLQDEVSRLEEENDDLRRQLDRRPSEADRERLQSLENKRETWERKRHQLRQEIEDLKNQISRKGVAAAHLERLRNEKEALEAHVDALQRRLSDIQADVDEITGGHGPFPKLSSLDESAAGRPREVEDDVEPQNLVEHVQSQVASRDVPLYYPLKTIRLFTSGLATSRLLILEGVSGTGKSSLPEAFAEAVGGGHGSVSVQSDWKDRHDLLGHYNSFENRFHETDFLEHLYRAQLPEYEDRPYFIVLDEMNLSRPEYYFADFLSKLEDRRRRGPDEDVFVPLLSHPLKNVDRLPAGLRETKGQSIKIPKNVWFVGTANQDETTLRFAPKTYDRAHVIEMPRSRADVSGSNVSPMDPPLDWKGVLSAFKNAQGRYSGAAEDVVEVFDSLSGYLYDKFSLSWGNRLENQARRFVSSYRSTGGSTADAADHLLATKVLRKIKGRFDLRKDDLDDLELEILGTLENLEDASDETGDESTWSSLTLIREEKRRLS
jgi:predicted  nucleic acid-binding Zn-ribbon protein